MAIESSFADETAGATRDDAPPDDARADADRFAVLQRTGILDTPPEPRFDAITAAVRALFDVPVALVSLVDRDRQWFKSRQGTDLSETPLDTSVCALAIRQDRLFVIGDLSADPRTLDFSLVTGEAGLRFYAGFPIITGDGVAVGSLCAIDTVARPHGVTPEQAVAIEALARQAAIEIERGLRGTPAHDMVMPFSVGSWDWDIPADRMTADARLARLMGAEPEMAARGVPIRLFMDRVHPADAPRVRAAIDATVAGRAPYSCEYRLRVADGSWRWVLAQGRLVRDAGGRPLRFPGATFDVDARRTAEQRLAALVELNDRLREPGDADSLAYAASAVIGETLDVSRVGYARVDAGGESLSTVRQWLAKGAAPLDETIALARFPELIDRLTRGETIAIGDIAADPVMAPRAAGFAAAGVRSGVGMPLIEDGRFVALVIVNDDAPREWKAEDIDFIREVAERTRHAVERRRIEIELEQLNASLEAEVEARTSALMIAEEHLRQSHKMEAVGQLTGGIAHDFNNLLTAISGSIEMLQFRLRQGRTDGLDRYTAAAHEAVKRAAALTHRLLAFSRRQTLDPKPTDINRLVAGMEDMIRRTVGPACEVEAKPAAGIWTTLVDPNQLENALLNLCINARDAMPHGGRITIATGNATLDEGAARERDLAPGDYVTLCVADTGTGMPPEVKARAFDPFYTTKPIGEGTGLGLSMIYGFARQSGGQVHIDTVEGQGTAMLLYLPRHADEPRETTILQLGSMGPAREVPGAGRRVLVVDDEPAVRRFVAESVAEMGFLVREAGDGNEGLAALRAAPSVELLITDIGLPGGMNGRELADAALALMPALKVLFITGYAENAAIGAAELPPNMRLITKPFTMTLLAERVRELAGVAGDGRSA